MATTRSDGIGAAESLGTTTVLPKGSSARSVSLYASESNDVLEQDAQTKGQWFQYVKTKQFWITLILGQGKHPNFFLEVQNMYRPAADKV